MTEILDLDAVLSEDIVVVLREREFPIPGDPPMEIYVRLLDMQQRAEDLSDDAGIDEQRELLDSVLRPVHELFALRQPELSFEELRGLIGMQGIALVIARVMEIYTRRGVEPPERPTRATSRSRKSSRPSGSK